MHPYHAFHSVQSQYDAAKSVNEKQLQLYYGIGKYISVNSRNGFWGSGAVDVISDKLDKELPGLKGFSARNLRYMRSFYEEWSELDNNILNLEPTGSKRQNVSNRSIFFNRIFTS